ncbi:hypothetical protein HOY82DRAFT_101547 [Tuber indicum]|nr:hypothetical protein HOY82DRAFT_101547 [Tuber indicum]
MVCQRIGGVARINIFSFFHFFIFFIFFMTVCFFFPPLVRSMHVCLGLGLCFCDGNSWSLVGRHAGGSCVP